MWQISRISNVIPISKGQTFNKDNFSDAQIPGRIIFDVWRVMRHEVALLNYTFENVMYNVMHERISCPTFQMLTEWWNHENMTMQWRVITHYIIRVVGTLRILIHLDIIGLYYLYFNILLFYYLFCNFIIVHIIFQVKHVNMHDFLEYNFMKFFLEVLNFELSQ